MWIAIVLRSQEIFLRKPLILISTLGAPRMVKAKKRREEKVQEVDQIGNVENNEIKREGKARKRSKKSELDREAKPEMKKSRQKKSIMTEEKPSATKFSRANAVHIDSLQSIFATKDFPEGTFTLFGGDTITAEITETVSPPLDPVPSWQPPPSQSGERKPLYFFPHFESPERNALSLFPVSDEPFFHHRTEYANISLQR